MVRKQQQHIREGYAPSMVRYARLVIQSTVDHPSPPDRRVVNLVQNLVELAYVDAVHYERRPGVFRVRRLLGGVDDVGDAVLLRVDADFEDATEFLRGYQPASKTDTVNSDVPRRMERSSASPGTLSSDSSTAPKSS